MFEVKDSTGLGSPVLGDDELITHADELSATVSRAQSELFALLHEIDRREAWRADGAQSLAHWVSIRYGISAWKAERWVAAAEALETLPQVAQAFSSGLLGIDKVVELTRFATPETEAELIPWAHECASGAIKRRAEIERRRERREVAEAERGRSVTWGYTEDGARFELEAVLPADQGAVIAKALSRLAEKVPVLPADHDHPYPADARRADALVMLCSGAIASDPDQDRATVVVHTRLETLVGPGAPNGEVEHGPVIAPETVQRLACDSRLQVVTEDAAGNPLRLGRLTRTPSAGQVRQLRYRDKECRSPGVADDGSPPLITSGGGPEVASPTSTTSCCSAASTTGSYTKADGDSRSTPTRPFDGSGRTGCGIGQYRRRRVGEHTRLASTCPAELSYSCCSALIVLDRYTA